MDDLKKINEHLNKVMNTYNKTGMPDFEGYSPDEMFYIFHKPFDLKSPIQFNQLAEADYKKIPMLNQVKYLLKIIDEKGELKLTKKGFLPTKVVSELYKQGFIKEYMIESGISKLYKETDSQSINLTRILAELSGIVKKRKGSLSLTKKGKLIWNNNFNLLLLLFKTFANKFNWAYYDGYGENNIGQAGYGFSLILLSKYGQKQRIDKFYAEKYFKAYPVLKDAIDEPGYAYFGSSANRCYSIRTFDRFLNYFGLINIESEDNWGSDKFITKTELFDRLINIKPHKNFTP